MTILFYVIVVAGLIIAGLIFWQLLRIHELVNSRFSATQKDLSEARVSIRNLEEEVERLGGPQAPVHDDAPA